MWGYEGYVSITAPKTTVLGTRVMRDGRATLPACLPRIADLRSHEAKTRLVAHRRSLALAGKHGKRT